jgi:MYXO-CTERM domain-containing protein
MSLRTSVLSIGALCLIGNFASAEQLGTGIDDLDLSRLVTGLNQPTGAVFLPDGRLVIMEYAGALKVQMPGGGRLVNAGTLPVSQNSIEQGALGIAVDPMFATSHRIYFYYSRGSSSNDRHAIGWTTIAPDSNQVDVGNITNVLTGIYGPANHNGGGLEFGPDGYLYIGTGDTGCNCGCSPGQADNYNGTCLTNFQGKILRIDRDGNIPPTNPLVNVAQVKACPVSNARPCQTTPPSSNNMAAPATEIYNWGFRNAWRFSWDEQTGFMWIGDVGEVTWEEVTVSQGPGEHHGWPFREGAHGLNASSCGDSTASSGATCVDPAFEYTHSESPAFGQGSVTGGVFSNHCSWPTAYRGKYWFGDYNKGRIWTITPNDDRTSVVADSRDTIVTSAGGPVHFFNGPDHAVYTVDIDNGRIYRLAPSNPVPCEQDAGPADPDTGGTGPLDASPNPDAQPTPLDAAPAAPPPRTRTAESTCGCKTTGSTSDRRALPFSILLVLGLGALRRRR